ncbi:hypothetical protein AVEN_225296-1 [Araneus ventricosus]|uniref:HTH psq-type domain-containing protein n=1 Tax=Araneus ventricosus TaxID=182803 RepID=A0A4Y2ALN7_ARAVE|nr:hypothetical protein AVEN_225296-1 [Araneus ventricosus]
MPKRALSSTVASGTKRKHVTLSIKDKVNLIKKLESGRAVAKLCEEYGLGRLEDAWPSMYDLMCNRPTYNGVSSVESGLELGTLQPEAKTLKLGHRALGCW